MTNSANRFSFSSILAAAILASKILAKALVEEGKFVKAIPSFGFERRGAPVESYLRFDNKTIRQVTNIYYPNCVVCLDPTLPKSVNIFSNLKDKAIWVQATKKDIDQLNVPEIVKHVGLCDAFGISLDIFGKTITNSIMLGAFAKTTGIVSIESLKTGMGSVAFRDAALDKNVEAIQRGYEETTVIEFEKKDTR